MAQPIGRLISSAIDDGILMHSPEKNPCSPLIRAKAKNWEGSHPFHQLAGVAPSWQPRFGGSIPPEVPTENFRAADYWLSKRRTSRLTLRSPGLQLIV